MTTRIFLIRHGQVAPPWDGRIYGDLDVPLSDEGRAVSRAVAARLAEEPWAAVVSSGLERTDYLAAELVRCRAGVGAEPPLLREPRLREIHRGDWAGFGEPEVEAQRPGGWRRWWDAGGMEPPPGGETLEQVRDRVGAALDELARAHDGQRIAVAAHRWVVRAAVCRLLGLALEQAPRLDVPPCGVVVVDWADSGAGPSEGRLVFAPGGVPR